MNDAHQQLESGQDRWPKQSQFEQCLPVALHVTSAFAILTYAASSYQRAAYSN